MTTYNTAFRATVTPSALTPREIAANVAALGYADGWTAADDVAVDTIRLLLKYEPDTGLLFWRPRSVEFFSGKRLWKTWNTRFAGKPALNCASPQGYRHGSFLGKPLKAHRVAWVIQTGEWPVAAIDHIDTDKSNNRWENLRLATREQNGQNRGLNANNSSGHKGVCWHAREGKWRAQIGNGGKKIYLGSFKEKEAAMFAYAEANARLHGTFGRLS